MAKHRNIMPVCLSGLTRIILLKDSYTWFVMYRMCDGVIIYFYFLCGEIKNVVCKQALVKVVEYALFLIILKKINQFFSMAYVLSTIKFQ